MDLNDNIVICTKKSTFESIKENIVKDGFNNVYWIYECIKYEDYTNRLLIDSYESQYLTKVADSKDFEQKKFKALYNSFKSVKRANSNHIVYHRKMWEWCYIAMIFQSMGYLEEGKKGLGFAVGHEPLPAYFASKDVDVLATDIGCDTDTAKLWAETNQNAESTMENLIFTDICGKDDFISKVSYRDVDMNDIPDDLCKEEYDFCWSSCAIEHVGSLELSKRYLKNMIRCIKPGGMAIHTTELNLSSDEETIEHGTSILWRKKDILEIKEYMENKGCVMDLSFTRSNTVENNYIDCPPFEGEGMPYHMTLVIDGYVSTSIALVIRKNEKE